MKHIACFNCGKTSDLAQQLCEACGLDLASEIDDRERAALFLGLAAAALSLGAVLPFVALLSLGQLDRGLAAVAGAVIVVLCLAGVAVIYARRLRPVYIEVRSEVDLRNHDRR